MTMSIFYGIFIKCNSLVALLYKKGGLSNLNNESGAPHLLDTTDRLKSVIYWKSNKTLPLSKLISYQGLSILKDGYLKYNSW